MFWSCAGADGAGDRSSGGGGSVSVAGGSYACATFDGKVWFHGVGALPLRPDRRPLSRPLRLAMPTEAVDEDDEPSTVKRNGALPNCTRPAAPAAPAAIAAKRQFWTEEDAEEDEDDDLRSRPSPEVPTRKDSLPSQSIREQVLPSETLKETAVKPCGQPVRKDATLSRPSAESVILRQRPPTPSSDIWERLSAVASPPTSPTHSLEDEAAIPPPPPPPRSVKPSPASPAKPCLVTTSTSSATSTPTRPKSVAFALEDQVEILPPDEEEDYEEERVVEGLGAPPAGQVVTITGVLVEDSSGAVAELSLSCVNCKSPLAASALLLEDGGVALLTTGMGASGGAGAGAKGADGGDSCVSGGGACRKILSSGKQASATATTPSKAATAATCPSATPAAGCSGSVTLAPQQQHQQPQTGPGPGGTQVSAPPCQCHVQEDAANFSGTNALRAIRFT